MGALVGLLATGLLCRAALPLDTLPILIAPMGASAVLLFAVPASQLAQPWSILGGNVMAATVGVGVASLVSDPFLAAALAGAGAIALMMSCRCLHPPSGAVALTAVLGGPAIRNLGYGFVLWPVAANSLLLVAAAFLFNNLVGRSYPHRPLGAPTGGTAADAPPPNRIGFTTADIDAVLAEYDQLLDIDRADLEAILREAEFRSYRRRSGLATCAAVMVRDVVAIAPGATIGEALDLLRAHPIKVLPVTDDSARVLGLVTQTDLLDKASWDRRGPRSGFRQGLRHRLARGRAPNGSVAEIMTVPVPITTPDMPLADVVHLMARSGLQHLPVVDRDERLAGVVSQSDLMAALLDEASHAPHSDEGDAEEGAP